MAEGLVLNEQRRLNRRELLYYLKIVDRASGLELGRMADIHAEGMLILGDRPLTKGAIYRSDLELPKTLAERSGRTSLAIDFESLWDRPGPKNSIYYENGVRFLNLDSPSRILIGQLIDLFAMPSGKFF